MVLLHGWDLIMTRYGKRGISAQNVFTSYARKNLNMRPQGDYLFEILYESRTFWLSSRVGAKLIRRS